MLIPVVSGEIIINEFLPNPIGKDTQDWNDGEWIELFNTNNSRVDLSGYVLKDSKDTNELYIGETNTKNVIIKPYSYAIIYRNGEGDFSLNNVDYDEVRLIDRTNTVIDKVGYSSINEGVSWARIEDKWVRSVPSPGKPNLFYLNVSDSILSIDSVKSGVKFGDLIELKISVFKGDTNKNVLKYYIKDIGNVYQFKVFEKFTNYSFVLPLEIPFDCKEGSYTLYLDGFDKRVNQSIFISKSNDCVSEDEKFLNKGGVIFENSSIKQKRWALYFFCFVLILIIYLKNERN